MNRSSIEIYNNSNIHISGYGISIMKKIIKSFFDVIDIPYYLSIVIINDEDMMKLNEIYLAKDTETDIISFSFLNNYDFEIFKISYEAESVKILYDYILSGVNKDKILPQLQLGEIYISADQALAYSQINKTSLNKELNWILLHGLLHIIDYEDDTEYKKNIMNKKAEYYLNNFYNKNYKRRSKD